MDGKKPRGRFMEAWGLREWDPVRELAEASPDRLVVLDPEGRIAYVNREGERSWGSREEIVGRPFADACPEASEGGVEAAFERIRAGGPGESIDRYREADGHWYTLDLLPLENGVGIHFRNVDERLMAESGWKTLAERLEVTLEATSQGWYELWVVSGRAEVSEAYWSILGEVPGRGSIPFEEWIGRLHSDDRERILRAVDEVVRGDRDLFESEYRFRSGDGSHRWIADLGRVVDRDPEGRATRIVGVVRDVTPRKEAQIALRRSEEAHRLLFETMAQGVVYHDVEGAIVSANPAAERILGTPVERMRGLSPADPRWRVTREDGSPLPPRDHPVARASRTCEDVDGVVLGLPDPERGGVRWVIVDARPVSRSGETCSGVYSTLTDVTSLREAERALGESEERYRAIVENAPDVVSRIGPDLRTTFVSRNVGRYVAAGAEAIIGKRISEIPEIPPDMGRRLDATVRAVFEDGRPRSEQLQFPGRDGLWYFEWRLFPEYDAEGRITTVASVLQDETEARRLEERVREAQKMEAIGQLAGGVAHDFNNLLTVMRGFGDLALESVAEGDPVREDIEEILRAADRASALTRQLLAFGRRQVMEARVVDLGQIVTGMETMLRRLIGAQVPFEVTVEPGVRRVRVDPGQMEQVIMNLVVNARDAVNGSGGGVRVRVRNGGGGAGRGPAWVCVDVEDDGVGMDPETVARIFEPFFTTKPAGQGTGLGLATVYGFVRQGRGRVDVVSAPGQGSVFTVSIPAAEGPEPEVAEPLDAVGEDGPEVDATILVVEDEKAVRELARRVLEKKGYRILTAADPAEATEILEGSGGVVDLLLTDIVMPGMNGKDLVRLVREEHPGVRALLMTGYDGGQVETESRAMPAPLLRKPFSSEELIRAVADALA